MLTRGGRNYDHLAGLWELEDWIDAKTAQQARTHYSAYSVHRRDGLRIVTINTDFCMTSVLLYVSEPDTEWTSA